MLCIIWPKVLHKEASSFCIPCYRLNLLSIKGNTRTTVGRGYAIEKKSGPAIFCAGKGQATWVICKGGVGSRATAAFSSGRRQARFDGIFLNNIRLIYYLTGTSSLAYCWQDSDHEELYILAIFNHSCNLLIAILQVICWCGSCNLFFGASYITRNFYPAVLNSMCNFDQMLRCSLELFVFRKADRYPPPTTCKLCLED